MRSGSRVLIMTSSGGLAPTVFPHSADLCIHKYLPEEVLLYKVESRAADQKFVAFNECRNVITVFTTARCRTLSRIT